MFYDTLEQYIALIALWIGYVGIAIVLFGVLGSVFKFLYYLPSGHSEEGFARMRHFLMLYLTISLDFLIAKDIILTLSIEREGYIGLVQLLLLVTVRIFLSYFIHMEESFLDKFKSTRKPRK
ncbi:DUF1622 domain-containing protein [Patescibacteria group bacterium]|nr:DUF1622 domain-containing protein [Patescibacteria group bacterium]